MKLRDLKRKFRTPTLLASFSKSYFAAKAPDMSLYAQDGFLFPVHKEIFCQSAFMRSILKSAKEECCGELSILVPALTRQDLKKVIDFLYTGYLLETDLKTVRSLEEVFGFPDGMAFKIIPIQSIEEDAQVLLSASLVKCEEAHASVKDDNDKVTIPFFNSQYVLLVLKYFPL